MQLDLVVTCKRCGLRQSAEFCIDCRKVAPKMCAGGLDSRGMRAKRKQEWAEYKAERKMLERVAGRSPRR